MTTAPLILGAGYVGERFATTEPSSVRTHRQTREGSLRFDLADPTTWELPHRENVLWTFPSAPIEQVVRFRDLHLVEVCSLVVLGSTSAYLTTEPDSIVDETTPLDLAQARVAGEEALRERGATILSVAGIWGPGRDPLRWLLDGRIRNGRKYVNLAHVDDILAAIASVFETPRPGERINVSDGEPRRWFDHVERLKSAGRLPADFTLPDAPAGSDSRQIQNRRLRELIPGRRFTLFT